MAVSVILTFNDVPLGDFDAPLLVLMFGFFIGALAFPSTFARFDAQTQTLFLQREQWGLSREKTLQFSEIESIKRIVVYQTGRVALAMNFRLVVNGREVPLTSKSLPLQQANELEEYLRAILPRCPVSPVIKENFTVSGRSLTEQEALIETNRDVLIVRSPVVLARVGYFVLTVASAFTFWNTENAVHPFLRFCFVVVAWFCLIATFEFRPREWRFDSQDKQVILLEVRVKGNKERVFQFEDIRGIRRESFIIKPEAAPSYELFRLFIQIGGNTKGLLLSPKDLTLAQADELERAVRDVLGDAVPCLSSDATAG